MTLQLSYEVFPPKKATGLARLDTTAMHLAESRPRFISVTYGAGGSEHQKSFKAIETVVQHSPVAAHLTCVGQSRDELDEVLDQYQDLGVTEIVALRGDPKEGIGAPYYPHPKGYQQTAELVAAIKEHRGLTVSVSAYPEVHPNSPDRSHDLDVLSSKVDAGASRAITQMFFDNKLVLDLQDEIEARKLEVSLVAGIFPIHNFTAVQRFAKQCGASIPETVAQRFIDLENAQLQEDQHKAASFDLAVQVAAEQIRDLYENGIDAIHLYTINRSALALAVAEAVSDLR